MVIYDKVKDACKESNITINSLEDTLGFARGSLYKWNAHIPSVEKIMMVAKELNKPIEYFLSDEKEVG